MLNKNSVNALLKLNKILWALTDTGDFRCKHFFIVTIFDLPRRLQDVFKISSRRVCNILSKDVVQSSWKKKRYAEDIFNTSSPRGMSTGFKTPSNIYDTAFCENS